MDVFAGHEAFLAGIGQIVMLVWYASNAKSRICDAERRITALETATAADRAMLNQNNAMLQRIDERTAILVRPLGVAPNA